jgi:hypothetical protein
MAKKNHPRCWKGKMMDEEGKETNTYGLRLMIQ